MSKWSFVRSSSVLVVATSLGALGVVAPVSVAGAQAAQIVKVAHFTIIKGHGKVLVNQKGHALYTYGPDVKNHSHCTAGCLSAWPALKVKKGQRPGGVKGLTSFQRSPGVYQVSWYGKPLYTYVGDTKAGVVTGNGVAGFKVATAKKSTRTKTTTTTSGGYGGY